MTVKSLLACAVVAACSVTTAQASQKVEWAWSVQGNPRAFTVGMETLAAVAKEKTNGAFAITIHYGESITPTKETLDSVKIGAIDGGIMCISYAPGKAPLMSVLDLPFLPFGNLEVQMKVHEAVYDHPEVIKEMKQWAAIPFFSALLPQYEFMGAGEPPRELDQWKGMRVRALAGLGDAMRHLGAVPTSVPAPEAYNSLERGVVRAAAIPFSYAHAAYRLHEVSTWYKQGLSPGTGNCPLVISESSWNSLPQSYRDILTEAKPVAYQAVIEAYAKADEKNVPMFDKAGLQVITYTPEQRATFEERAAKPVWDAWVEQMEAKGLKGRAVLEYTLEQARKFTGS